MKSPPLHQRLRLGKLWYRVYHEPIGRLVSMLRQGGPWVMRETERHRQEMASAAERLPPLPIPREGTPLRVHLLTGSRFWHQTAFCLHSFVRAAGEPVRFVLYDDGTLQGATAGLVRGLGPAICVRPQQELVDQLDRHLPVSRFPTLRERWINYPHIRKLIDVHIASTGWKMVIDSDLLFFRRPDVVIDWLYAPDRSLHAVDCSESYGYSRSLMSRLAGASIPALVNVGLCGLRSDSLNWTELEAWCAELIARERTSYYLEQALVAMLAARQSCMVAPASDYVTRPSRSETIAPTAVMHHYVAESKRWYYRYGWRHIPS